MRFGDGIMTQEREVQVEGKTYEVTVSDDQQALLAAKAAGRAIVGYLHEGGDQRLSAAQYLIESPDVADGGYLERVVRRHLGLPWVIAESERLVIREFTMEDIAEVVPEEGDLEPDMVFYTAPRLEAYIQNQYRFFEYGIWAVIRKKDGVLLGKAGVADADMGLELGYHIFQPYRRQGYAAEACRAVLDYVKREFGGPVYAATDPGNESSARLLKKLGFQWISQRYNAAGKRQHLYGWNC